MNYSIIREIKNVFCNDYDKQILTKAISKSIMNCKEVFDETNKFDVANGGDVIDFDKILDLSQHYLTKDNLYHLSLEEILIDNNRAKKTYCSRGICGISVQENDVYAIFEIILSNLLCHNISILNLENNKNYGVINMLVEILNMSVYTVLGLKEVIFITKETYQQFENDSHNLDLMIYIGNNKYLKSRVYDCLIDYKAYCFGEYKILYEQEELLNNFIKNKSTNVKFINYSDIKNITDTLNKEFNYCCSILTAKQNDALYFANHCRSQYIFVNSLPFVQQTIDIPLTDLLEIKTIFK